MSSMAKVCVLVGLGIAGLIIVSRQWEKKKRQKKRKEDFGAFIERLELLPPPQPAPPVARHILTDLTFALQDIFDVEGYVTGFGNPDWLRTHDPAAKTAGSVSLVVAHGATCVGKTVMDELAYSITGENRHYGTPTNPAIASRIPGGSASGSAVAVAAKLVDFALGIDTDGSVRIPAAFCGILGFRPSHGSVSTFGVVPMAQSFDTVGWFARDANVLRRVGHVLLQLPMVDLRRPRRILIADDCFELSSTPKEKIVDVVVRSIQDLPGRQVVNHVNLGQYITSKVPSLKIFRNEESRNGEGKSALKDLSNAFELLQRYEFKMNHEEWVSTVKPHLGYEISVRVRAALESTEEKIQSCLKARNEMREALCNLLKDDGILVIPTVPILPPNLRSKKRQLEEFYSRAFSVLSISGMSGCCQVSIPLGMHEGCPLAVSLMARHGADRFLLDTILDLHPSLQKQAEIASNTQPSISDDCQIDAAENYKEKGNAAYKGKQFHKAVNFYSEAIKLNDTNATYYSNRAAACLELGRFQQAEEDCSKAIEIDRKNVKAYLRRGTAREMLSYIKDAIEDFKFALVLEPTNKTASTALERLKKFVL
ncbi:outer envelope protein 64, chloroplastic isoform X1 [Cryptomeria japonica]|uniref:outer envelope protein 64, chloroplastic isoform X1 n=1 Tax=Cryptomeria japonica TaxID=3369 RepID=UPI0025AD5A02|nr:outer envelope protein 64, chloroplastic isoform X1 [Cryptomeria japonica]